MDVTYYENIVLKFFLNKMYTFLLIFIFLIITISIKRWIGDYEFVIENKGFDNYRIIRMEKINNDKARTRRFWNRFR